MKQSNLNPETVIIGGGFYGAAIAHYLSTVRGFKHILLIESTAELLSRASYHNQARVHNGYHYPRNLSTGYRSRINLPHFIRDWQDAITRNFTNLYAIAGQDSKVTVTQFERFCQKIGAKIQKVDPGLNALFNPKLIEKVFLTEEYCFDARALKRKIKSVLEASGLQLLFESHVTAISRVSENKLRIHIKSQDQVESTLCCHSVFNCTYSGLNQFKGDFSSTQTPLKQEITEIALIEPPATLKGLGITVMDGPFFSMMPFPARGLHSLTHVRYTPHLHWQDAPHIDPYQKLKQYEAKTRVNRMIRDSMRYLPELAKARYIESLFEVKTTLIKNEEDDGRPILFEKHAELPHCYSILGGKLDNIYDIFAKLDAEPLYNSAGKS